MKFSDLKKTIGQDAESKPVPREKKPVSGFFDEDTYIAQPNTPPPSPEEAVSGEKADKLRGQAAQIYSGLVSTAKGLLDKADQPYIEKYESIIGACSLISEHINSNIFFLHQITHSSGGNYLYCHSANVALISLAMASTMGLNKEETRLLGFCALAHDLGMTGLYNIFTKETPLTDGEISSIAEHPLSSADKVERIIDIDFNIKSRAKKIISQLHERVDGSGYPYGLRAREIDPLAKIIAVADSYEAMTHARPWRAALHPHQAVRTMLSAGGFDQASIKSFIETFSIYPPGSTVVLSTGEIAETIAGNRTALARPVIKIIMNPDFAEVPQQLLDLEDYPLTSIARIVTAEEIEEKNHKFGAARAVETWLTDW